MTEELLRKVLEEAKEKGQTGLLIWHNCIVFDAFADELKEGNEYYDFALSQVSQNSHGTITGKSIIGIILPIVLIVPINKMITSEEYFNSIFQLCQEDFYRGPITLLPQNKVADVCDES